MRALHVAFALFVVAACATETGGSTNAITPPDRATFPAVSDLLARRCGSLDCHGQVSRNFRLYSAEGLRLDPNARPTSKTNTTTPAEYDQTYASLIGLEPEIIGAVVTEGSQPERLTLVRKARGVDHHKGNTLMNPGDEEDLCLTSWLTGHADPATCTKALTDAF